MNKVTPIVQVVQSRLHEFDKQIGGLTDYHLKWIKGYVYYQLQSRYVTFYFNNTVSPRRLLVMPLDADGKIISIFGWLKFKFKLWKQKNKNKPALHPDYWPGVLELSNCKIKFIRTPPKEAIYERDCPN